MRRLERLPIPVVATSHSGMKRKENEDRFGVAAFSMGPRGPQPVILAVLCDGIGGHRAGEVAAELAVNIISQVVADSDALNPPRILTYAIETASDAIRDQAIEINEQSGMGATCACAWLVGDRLYTATVGDSRVYLLRDGRIQRVSTDHTWIQEALERGTLRPEQVSGHPNAHIIRRYLGSPVAPDVDLRLRVSGEESDDQALANQGTFLFAGDRIVLTSDGLTDLVTDLEILESFQQQPADTAVESLIALANSRGGHDNITLITFEGRVPVQSLQATQRVPVRSAGPGRSAWRWAGLGCVGVLALAALVGLVASGLWFWRGDRARLDQGTQPSSTLSVTLPVIQATATFGSGTPVSPTQTAALPSSTPSRTPAAPLPTAGGATLTPWPTNTPSQ